MDKKANLNELQEELEKAQEFYSAQRKNFEDTESEYNKTLEDMRETMRAAERTIEDMKGRISREKTMRTLSVDAEASIQQVMSSYANIVGGVVMNEDLREHAEHMFIAEIQSFLPVWQSKLIIARLTNDRVLTHLAAERDREEFEAMTKNLDTKEN